MKGEEGEIVTHQPRKMSEMISEMAASFIGVGKTAEEKQSRLTAACSAWNMACGSPEIRRQQLDQYVEGYHDSILRLLQVILPTFSRTWNC